MSETTTETTEQTGIATLGEGDRYEVLRAERRRHAVEVLAGRTGPVDLDRLALTVAARDAETDSTDEDELERVAISLHHTHLPKLAAFDLVDYDRANNRIERSWIPSDL